MRRIPLWLMVIVAVVPTVLVGNAISAQDKYTVQVPGGLAFSEFKGYENWQVISVSHAGDFLAVILGNPEMIEAYQAGAPGNGKPFPDGAKMAKSTGNLTLVADLLETAPAAAVRLMLLDRRWSEGWEFRPELLPAATDALHELYAAAARPGTTGAAEEQVVAVLLDDLDVPRALAAATEAGGAAGRLLVRVLSLG